MSTTWLDVAGDGNGEEGGVVEHNDGKVYSESWYRRGIHFGRLHEGSVVYNTALMGACS